LNLHPDDVITVNDRNLTVIQIIAEIYLQEEFNILPSKDEFGNDVIPQNFVTYCLENLKHEELAFIAASLFSKI